jgi:hypothetical protein
LEDLIAVSALQLAPLADGPAQYFGSTIMTFALPFGALIAAAIALFFIFRATHSGPRLRWSSDNAAHVASVTTREPGPAPAPGVIAATPATSMTPDLLEQKTLVEAAAAAEPAREEAATPTETPADKIEGADETKGKDGEQG